MKKTTRRRLPHLAGKIFGTPLAIEPRKLTAILAALGPRLEIEAMDQQDEADAAAGKAERAPYAVKDGVAVIDVMGSLTHRTMAVSAMSGLTSYQQLSAEIAAAEADPDVKSILLMMDSPGGEVAGMYDLAAQVCGCSKPTVALAQDMAASAAYLIASAADKVLVSQSGVLGSIGIVLAHTDTSAADASAGVKVSYIHAGARKVDGAMPLDHEHRASAQALQAEVDKYYGMFVNAVAAYRGMTALQVKDTEAAVYVGSDAVAAGLADGVATVAEALAMCAAQHAPAPAVAAEEMLTDDAPQGALEASRQETEQETSMTKEELAEMEGLKGRLAEANANAAAASAALSAVEDVRKQEVIEKHTARGAIVPSMVEAVKDLAASKKTGTELDAVLAKWPAVINGRSSGVSIVKADGHVAVETADGPLEKLKAIAATKTGMTTAAAFEAACMENPSIYREFRQLKPLGARVVNGGK